MPSTRRNCCVTSRGCCIAIRLRVSSLRIVGRATQGVRLINLEKKNDEIAGVCKVDTEPETTDEESVRDAFNEAESGSFENTENTEPSENTENTNDEQQNDNE